MFRYREFKSCSQWKFTRATYVRGIKKQWLTHKIWITGLIYLQRITENLYLSLLLQFIHHAAYSSELGAHTRFLFQLTLHIPMMLKTLFLTNLSYFCEMSKQKTRFPMQWLWSFYEAYELVQKQEREWKGIWAKKGGKASCSTLLRFSQN